MNIDYFKIGARIKHHRELMGITQEELADFLKKDGFRVTQATISRDIRELGLTKIATGGGKQKYTLVYEGMNDLNEKYLRVLREGYLSMDMAQNILVVKTVSGMAMAVAAALDKMHWPEIAGCIAGDDTIMCVLRSEADGETFISRMNDLIR